MLNLDTPEIRAAAAALSGAREVLAYVTPLGNTQRIIRAQEYRDTLRAMLSSRIQTANPTASPDEILSALAGF